MKEGARLLADLQRGWMAYSAPCCHCFALRLLHASKVASQKGALSVRPGTLRAVGRERNMLAYLQHHQGSQHPLHP